MLCDKSAASHKISCDLLRRKGQGAVAALKDHHPESHVQLSERGECPKTVINVRVIEQTARAEKDRLDIDECVPSALRQLQKLVRTDLAR